MKATLSSGSPTHTFTGLTEGSTVSVVANCHADVEIEMDTGLYYKVHNTRDGPATIGPIPGTTLRVTLATGAPGGVVNLTPAA